MAGSIEVIDLAPFRSGTDKASVVRAVSHACETVGFLVVGGHGVPQTTIDALVDASSRFFALPLAKKEKMISPDPQIRRGYSRMESLSLAKAMGVDTPPDLREAYSINRVHDNSAPYFHTPEVGKLFAPNIWPANVLGFQEAFTAYYLALEALASEVMRIFALALDLPECSFDDKIDKHFSNMTAFYYPALSKAPALGQLRGGVHTDFGSMTFVYGHPSAAGLQVWIGSDWEDVPLVPGTFVVNIGDLMAQWTNDRWVSTLHRVVNPLEHDWAKPRLSLAFFHQPNYDCLVENLDRAHPAKYPPVTSGEHLRRKIMAMRVAPRTAASA
jgi:isopenicillin N synthase-like dioxygenase